MQLTIDGLKTNYIVNGNFEKIKNEKPTIIFLHGWGGSIGSFIQPFNYVSNFYPCLALDFYGFGDSSSPKENFCLDDYVEQVKRLVDFYNLKNIILIGHSFGGRVAIKLSSRKNNFRINKLILVDSAGMKPKFSLIKFIKIKNYKIKKFLVKNKILRANCLTKYGSLDYKLLDENFKRIFIKIVNEFLENDAKNIDVKTLIVWGKNDKETPIYMAKKLNKLIKNSKINLLDGGHYAYIENNIDFLNCITQFLGE